MKVFVAALTAAALLTFAPASAQTPAAVIADPPVDAAHPASMAYVRIPSGGDLMNGVIYSAAGAGPHPTVLLLHGFPGNEQNLDLAQAMRRAGFNVLTMHYRGSWGSPGAFSFAHAQEDSDAALAFLRDPATVARFAIDPSRIFVAGHSMGGFMAASAAAHDPHVAGLILISAWDMAGAARVQMTPRRKAGFAEDTIPLAGTSVDSLLGELSADPARWDFRAFAPQLMTRPVLLVTSNDGNAPSAKDLEARLRAAGDRAVTIVHMDTDHPYSDHRIALESVVVEWLMARR